MGTLVATFDDSLSRVSLVITFTNVAVTATKVVRIAPDGIETILRSGEKFSLAAGKGTIYDYEVPLDVPVTYKATQVTPVSGSPEVILSGAAQTMLSHGKSWLKDPGLASNNLRLDYVQGLPKLSRRARAGVFDVIDRTNPIVVSAKRQSATGDFTFTTLTQTDYEKMIKLINRGEVLLLSTPPAYGVGNVYVHIGDVDEDRIAIGDASNWVRRWTLPLLVVDRPLAITSTAPLERWSDVKATWATWNDLYAANLTWDQLKALPAGATSPT